jgi:hypothetical protein
LHVEVLPAGAAVPMDTVAKAARADDVEAAESFAVDVHEFAGTCPLIPDDRITFGAGQA